MHRLKRTPAKIAIASTLLFSAGTSHAKVTLLEPGETTEWRYLDDGSDQGKKWFASDFDDAKWKKGKAPLGYGEDDQTTTLSFGGNSNDKHITTYFRTSFEVAVADREKIAKLGLTIRRDDGAVVYLNGKEALRSNMRAGAITFDSRATQALGTGIESNYLRFSLPADLLSDGGNNVVAVEIHQAGSSSSDLFLDLGIVGYAKGEEPKRDFYRDGMLAVQGGDYEQAAELLKQLPEDHPNYVKTMALLAHRIYGEALGRAAEGLPFAKRAYELAHDQRDVLRAYVKTHVLAGTMFDDAALTRKRSTKVADEHAFIVTMPNFDDRSETFTRKQLEEDLDYLEHVLANCFAYLELRPVDYRAALDAIRGALKEETPVHSFEICLAKLISLFCDGHAGVRRHESQFFPRGYGPFLAGSHKGRVYLHTGRAFLDKNHPYVTAIDGKPIAQWMRAASHIVVKESPQWRLRQSLENLRYIAYLRAELRLPNPDVITLSLESADRKASTEKKVELTNRLRRSPEFPSGETRRIGDIGYLRIPRMISSPQYLAELQKWMGRFRDTDGLIIDLRGNSGGTKSILFTLFPYFMAPDAKMKVVELSTYRMPMKVPKPTPQGFMMSDMSAQPVTSKRWTSDAQRKQVTDFIAAFRPEWELPMEKFSMWHVLALDAGTNPDAYHYDNPLVILHDAGTFSAGDIFLGAFEDHPNTTLIGEPSGGGNGWMESYTLPNSRIPLTLCQSAKFRPNGKPYDAVGIAPDVLMLATPDDILGKSDTVLDAALKRLE